MKRPGKTASVGAATAITTIGVWALKQFAHIDVPPEIAAAFMGLAAWGLTYFVPPSEREQRQAGAVSAPIRGEGR